MKQTIGRYIKIKDEDFPIALNFNDFYYYENADGNHLLLHTLTGKRSMDFYINSTNTNLVLLINQRLGLDIESITIYHNNESYYSATKNSEFFRSGLSGSSGYSGMIGYIDMSFILDGWDISDDKKEKVTKFVHDLTNVDLPSELNIGVNIENGDVHAYPRPPTE